MSSILLGRVCPGNDIVFLALACFVVFPILVIVLAVKVTGVTGVTIVSSWSSGRVKLVPNRVGTCGWSVEEVQNF